MKLFYTFLASILFLAGAHKSVAQGCVAVRPMNCSSGGSTSPSSFLMKGQWQAGLNFRYFESYKHFRGEFEQAERVEHGTEVINTTFQNDLSLTYAATDRLLLSVNLPITYNDRSSLYEHYGNSLTANPEQKRFHTKSFGPGDLRLTGSYWLFNPKENVKGNLSLGLGIKMPTGNYNVQDEFHRLTVEGEDTLITKPVDQSIQLGDGGWGFSIEAQGFRTIYRNTFGYFNGYYLFNPRETNNIIRNGTLTGAPNISTYFSVADQYSARVGIGQVLLSKYNLAVALGGRIEGIPSSDLIGGSEGFRRPGYIVSVDPSVSAQVGLWNFSVAVPYAMYRIRTRSESDKAAGTDNRYVTPIPTNGDAAFADYAVLVGIAYRFGKGCHDHVEMK